MAVKTHIQKRRRATATVYTGRRSELLKIEGIEPEMFPRKGGKKKTSPTARYDEPGWYCTIAQPVRRWRVALFKEKIGHPTAGKAGKITKLSEEAAAARRDSRDRHAPPAETSHLTADACHVAEGWELLPPRHKAHIIALIDDDFAELVGSPTLRALYNNANRYHQARFERVYAQECLKRR